MRKIRIAIDGPSGAGKSTMAKMVSKELGILYLDTGAMYRAVALKALREGISHNDEELMEEMVKGIDIRIEYDNGQQKVFLDGEDVTEKIRTPDVTVGAANVAVIPGVRKKMVELQRNIASLNSVVMDGRDIGTYDLTEADIKIFLPASVEDRTRRRYEELAEKGTLTQTFEDLKNEMEYRDKNDSSRSIAPLKKAEDAILLDTTGFPLEKTVKMILDIVKARVNNAI